MFSAGQISGVARDTFVLWGMRDRALGGGGTGRRGGVGLK